MVASNSRSRSRSGSGSGSGSGATEEQLHSQPPPSEQSQSEQSQSQSQLLTTINLLEQTVHTQTTKITQLTHDIQQLEQQQTLLSNTNSKLVEEMKTRGEEATQRTSRLTSQITSQNTNIAVLENTVDSLSQQLRVALQFNEQLQGPGQGQGSGPGHGLEKDHQTSSTQQRDELLRNKQTLEERLGKCLANGNDST